MMIMLVMASSCQLETKKKVKTINDRPAARGTHRRIIFPQKTRQQRKCTAFVIFLVFLGFGMFLVSVRDFLSKSLSNFIQ